MDGAPVDHPLGNIQSKRPWNHYPHRGHHSQTTLQTLLSEKTHVHALLECGEVCRVLGDSQIIFRRQHPTLIWKIKKILWVWLKNTILAVCVSDGINQCKLILEDKQYHGFYTVTLQSKLSNANSNKHMT